MSFLTQKVHAEPRRPSGGGHAGLRVEADCSIYKAMDRF